MTSVIHERIDDPAGTRLVSGATFGRIAERGAAGKKG